MHFLSWKQWGLAAADAAEKQLARTLLLLVRYSKNKQEKMIGAAKSWRKHLSFKLPRSRRRPGAFRQSRDQTLDLRRA